MYALFLQRMPNYKVDSFEFSRKTQSWQCWHLRINLTMKIRWILLSIISILIQNIMTNAYL